MTTQQKILLITSRPAQLNEFTQALCKDGDMEIVSVNTAKEAIATARELLPVLAIVDDQVGGVAGVDVIRRLIENNAFIQTAAISELSDKEFHNYSEGLGILAKLPLMPNKNDAQHIITLLKKVTANLV
ncbi:MAG: hypothetical protein PVI90_06575 [Desulfobacteraceae bacterium]|jgi:DNA-binding NarL/FixJ family response regulator